MSEEQQNNITNMAEYITIYVGDKITIAKLVKFDQKNLNVMY